MRYKIIEGEKFDLKDTTKAFDSSSSDGFSHEQVNVTGVVVFNSELKVLPYVSSWLTEALRSGQTPLSTISTYAKNFSYLIDFLEERRLFQYQKLDDCLLYIQEHTFKEYFAHLKNVEGLAPATISNRDSTFQAFFNNYLCKTRNNGKAIREDNPYERGLNYGGAKSKLVEMCSLDELTALMSCTKSEREKVLLQFMFDSGLRRSEIPRVTKDHIDEALRTNNQMYVADDNTIFIPSEYKQVRVLGSKGRNRQIYERYTLTSIHTLGRIRRYFSTPEYRRQTKIFGLEIPAFLNSYGKPYTVRAISKLFQRLSCRALKQGFIKRPINPHMLRHGFAGSLLRSPDLGVHAVDKLVLLQICLGHAFLKTTQIYTQLPYEIYGKVYDKNGEILTRSSLMENLNAKTKTRNY